MYELNREDEGGREERVPFDYPPIQNPTITYDSDQDKVSIVGQAVHPDSNRTSGISVRLSMSSESAMRLMRLLQRLQKDESFEVPSGRLRVVEAVQSGSRQSQRGWFASILTKNRGK